MRQGSRHSECSQRHWTEGDGENNSGMGHWVQEYFSFLFFERGERRLYYMLSCSSQPEGGRLDVETRLGNKNGILRW